MTHADPWDEMARLERQLDSELLGQLEDPLADVVTRPRLQSLSFGDRTARTSLRSRDADVEHQ